MEPWKTSDINEDYDIQWSNVIGDGISGQIFSCVDLKTGMECAMKPLEYNDLSCREASLHLQLSRHKSIVPVVGVYDNEMAIPKHPKKRRLIIVMEKMQGGELFYHIKTRKRFTEENASIIMYKLVSAVHHCHTSGIAHRDIKPENFLLSIKGDLNSIRLCDFGHAKRDQGDLSTPVFTPNYVSPQVLESWSVEKRKKLGCLPQSYKCIYDKSCDMWSLGVILYILLCGYPPFRGKRVANSLPFAMRQQIKSGNYQFRDDDWKDVSVEAKDLVKQLLNVDSSQRLTSEGLLQHAWIARHNEITPTLDEEQEQQEQEQQEMTESSSQTDVSSTMNTIDAMDASPVQEAMADGGVKVEEKEEENNDGQAVVKVSTNNSIISIPLGTKEDNSVNVVIEDTSASGSTPHELNEGENTSKRIHSSTSDDENLLDKSLQTVYNMSLTTEEDEAFDRDIFEAELEKKRRGCLPIPGKPASFESAKNRLLEKRRSRSSSKSSTTSSQFYSFILRKR